MAGSAALATRPSQLDRFLQALIGTEHNGMETSVLSALARLGYDPWAEAARLAGLSRAVAADDLASALASVPACGRPHTEAKTVALCLVQLLPPPTHLASGTTSARKPQGRRTMFVLLVGSLLGIALTSGLLIGGAFKPAFHAPLPTVAAATPAPSGQAEGRSHQAMPGRLANGSDADAPSSYGPEPMLSPPRGNSGPLRPGPMRTSRSKQP